jgi:signal transduction histidine kinase
MKLKNWNKITIPRRSRRRSVFYAFLAVGITLFCVNLNLFSIEAYFYDTLMRLKGGTGLDPRIRIARMEHSSLTENTKLLEKLVSKKPRSIVFFSKFDPSEIEADQKTANKFVALAEAARKSGVQVLIGTDIDLSGEVLPPYPISTLPHAPAIIHKDGTTFSQDKVVRRGLLTAFQEPSVYAQIALPELSHDDLLRAIPNLQGAYFYRPSDSWHFLIRFPDSTDLASRTFLQASLNLSENLAGTIILIDSLEKDAPSGFYSTPYSRVPYTNPRINVHASIVNSLITDSGVMQLPQPIQYSITFLVALLAVFFSVHYPPSRSTLLIIGVTATLCLSALVLFAFGSIWLRLAQPMATIVSIYYMVMPYRAILEYRRRWEVQEKHDILVQVEELKGNFLSLMSHDLKTPVARIQGLAEHLLRQSGLSNNQINELDQILESTEALDKFISKILNLTKIESEDIKLNPKSKDLNQIIEKCADKLRFQANQKNISINLDLEPLFPVQVDAALIIQVLTNLIDNAIKYSPKGSRVEIKTRDEGDSVSIDISDNGPGMEDSEVKNLFTKFYRGKSHPGDATKGSGLGLYLSKYFIELHKGTISASSARGEGSRFSITLPNKVVQ